MRTRLEVCLRSVNEVLLGKQSQVRLAMACLLARGHLLVEDLPGMGKTTLSHALAKVMGLDFQRIQFTSDLLPGDILGKLSTTGLGIAGGEAFLSGKEVLEEFLVGIDLVVHAWLPAGHEGKQ